MAILDADKEGFLRSETSLIQTIGRAARNVSGQVHMYADKVTPSMQRAIDETTRRRAKQVAYNEAHGVDPQPLRKKIADITDLLAREDADTQELLAQRAEPGRRARSRGRGAPSPPTSCSASSRTSPRRCTRRRPSCSSSSLPGCATRCRDLKKELRGMREAGTA